MRIASIAIISVLVYAAAFAQTPPQTKSIRSLVISGNEKPQEDPLSGGEGPQKPLSAGKRAYWECVLKHVRGQETPEAVDIILAACRALSGGS